MPNLHLRETAYVQLGSVAKMPLELIVGDSILTYNTEESKFELSEITEIHKSETEVECTIIKINVLPAGFTEDAIIYVKDSLDNVLYGYFTDEKPVVEGIDPDKLVNVIPGIHKYYSGGDWLLIETVDKSESFDFLYSIKVSKNHSFFMENVLISD